MLHRQIIMICSETLKNTPSTLCWQNLKIVNVKLGRTLSDHCALQVAYPSAEKRFECELTCVMYRTQSTSP